MAISHTQVIRQVNRREHSVLNGKFHFLRGDGKSHVSKENRDTKTLHESRFPGHVRSRQENHVTILVHRDRVTDRIRKERMEYTFHNQRVLVIRVSFRENKTTFFRHVGHRHVNIQQINVIQNLHQLIPFLETQHPVVNHRLLVTQFLLSLLGNIPGPLLVTQ